MKILDWKATQGEVLLMHGRGAVAWMVAQEFAISRVIGHHSVLTIMISSSKVKRKQARQRRRRAYLERLCLVVFVALQKYERRLLQAEKENQQLQVQLDKLKGGSTAAQQLTADKENVNMANRH